jgi:uncharacterized protein (TIGR03066 family)
MKTMRFSLVLPVVLGLTVALGATTREDKLGEVSKEKLVGVWEVTRGELPKGSTMEFTRDGKVKLVLKVDKEQVAVNGTYVLDATNLKMVLLVDGKEIKDKWKVVKLSDTELAWKDEKNMVEELKRVTPEKK